MTSEVIGKTDSNIAGTYARIPVVFEKGEGCTLWDENGKKYTDFVAGIAVCNLGHAHPKVAAALSRQAEKLVHVSNIFYTKPQSELAEWLVNNSFADRVFFCNSGAEANEASIKLARKYFSEMGESHKNEIITMKQSFHGRTMATLTATGQDKIKQGFQPVLPGFHTVPFNDYEALEAKVNDATCAVMLEPVQGEGGVVNADPEVLKKIRKLCDDKGILLIFDEIQTGMGRTGKLFGYQNFDVQPDIMSLAKALGNGLPIGAMLAKEDIMKALIPGSHASTFGGTPLVTAGALEVVKTFDSENIVEKGRAAGEYFVSKLNGLKEKHDIVEEVRGRGLLLGLKIKVPGLPVVKKCLEKGFIINCIQENVLRFIPPLVISNTEIDALIECLNEVLGEL